MTDDFEIVATVAEYPMMTYTIRQQIADSEIERWQRLNAFVTAGWREGNEVVVMTEGSGWSEPRQYWMRPLRPEDV